MLTGFGGFARLALAATIAVAVVEAPRGIHLQANSDGSGQQSRQAPDPTFSKDIAPILFAHCGACHHPAGPAPFSLLSYDAASPRASLIASATKRRFMPPWKAEPLAGGFVGQARLSDADIDLIQRWAAGGAIEGNPRDLPVPPPIAEGWQLGKPDLIVSPSEPFTLQAEGIDVFRIFVVPLPVDRLRYVRGLEFRPGNSKVVHHANIRIDRTPASRRFDEADAAPGYAGLISHSATYPDGHFLGWTPGQVAPLLPKEMAWRLDRGADLVVELHMQPSGKSETVQPSIGLFFRDDPPERLPLMIRLGRQSIDIPPGDKQYTIGDRFVLPVDVEVHAVQPHAHYRATRMEGTATLPDGTTRSLIEIKDWDFRWQHVYRYAAPFTLPRGTTLAMQYTFDNSAENARNPQLPPARVFWGQRSRDEMGDLWIQVLPRTERDLDTLTRALRPKVLGEDVLGYEREIERDPSNLALHDDVAQLYLQLGKPADAVRHFDASARLNPTSAATHFNLGTALSVAGRLDEAVVQYRQALSIRPAYAQAHNNLGSLFLQRGEVPEALAHLREAIRAEPTNVQVHYNLAAAYAASGDVDRAVETAQNGLKLSPAEPLASALRERLAQYREKQRR
jgi:Flp pilus assembly protein TadD